MLGVHTANAGEKFPLVENIVENLSVMINTKAINTPIAK